MYKFLIALLSLSAINASAQQVDLFKSFKNLKPRAIGPSGMSGRITAIDALHAKPNTIYIGAASGGVWKTENAGANWQPLFDEQPIQNIGSIAICQSNSSSYRGADRLVGSQSSSHGSSESAAKYWYWRTIIRWFIR